MAFFNYEEDKKPMRQEGPSMQASTNANLKPPNSGDNSGPGFYSFSSIQDRAKNVQAPKTTLQSAFPSFDMKDKGVIRNVWDSITGEKQWLRPMQEALRNYNNDYASYWLGRDTMQGAIDTRRSGQPQRPQQNQQTQQTQQTNPQATGPKYNMSFQDDQGVEDFIRGWRQEHPMSKEQRLASDERAFMNSLANDPVHNSHYIKSPDGGEYLPWNFDPMGMTQSQIREQEMYWNTINNLNSMGLGPQEWATAMGQAPSEQNMRNYEVDRFNADTSRMNANTQRNIANKKPGFNPLEAITALAAVNPEAVQELIKRAPFDARMQESLGSPEGFVKALAFAAEQKRIEDEQNWFDKLWNGSKKKRGMLNEYGRVQTPNGPKLVFGEGGSDPNMIEGTGYRSADEQKWLDETRRFWDN